MAAYRTTRVSEGGGSESTPPPQIFASPPSSPAEAIFRALASAGVTDATISATNAGHPSLPIAPSCVFGRGPASNNVFATMTTASAPPLSNVALNPSFGMFSPSIPLTFGGSPAGWDSAAASSAAGADGEARRTLAPFQVPGSVGSGASSANQAFPFPVAPGFVPSPFSAGFGRRGLINRSLTFGDMGASCGQTRKAILGASASGSLEPLGNLNASFGADRAALIGSPSRFTAAASTWALAGSARCRCPQRVSSMTNNFAGVPRTGAPSAAAIASFPPSTFGRSNLSVLPLMGPGAATQAKGGALEASTFASSPNPFTTAGAVQGSFIPSTTIPDRCTSCGGFLPHTNFSSEGLNTAGFGGEGKADSSGLGTVDPPWRATWEEGIENERALGGGLLMSLCAMEEYEGKSHEECRLEDYAQNRKNSLAIGGGPLDGATSKNFPLIVDGFVFAVPTKRQGTGNPAWQATPTRHQIGSSVSMAKIMSISAMWDYRNESHEELRLEDYAKNTRDCLTKGDTDRRGAPLTTARAPTRQRGKRSDPEWQETDTGAFVFEYPFLMSISAMTAYQCKSHEELRVEDYLKSSEECSTTAASQGGSNVPEALTTTPVTKSSLTSVAPPQQKGTGDPAWQPVLMEVAPAMFAEVLMSISAMKAYATKSHEELRVEYYLQSRK